MGSVAVVLACNTHWAPYLFKYKKALDNHHVKYDLIIWNREGILENVGAHIISYNEPDMTSSGDPFKIFKFFRFSKFVKMALKKKQYERVVFLGTYAWMPMLISEFLKKKYVGKYWIDVRDYQYEYNGVYRWMEKRVFQYAKYIAISSRMFETFLPKREYLSIHNIDAQMEEFCKRYKKVQSNRIRISYIGHVGFYDVAKRFINRLANDSRYIIQYYGQGSEILESYCKDKNIQNVDFCGLFDRNRTIEFYNHTDIINNLYGNDNIHVRTALSNKLYYSIFLKLPILVCNNTEMERIGQEYGFSYTFNDEETFADDLYKWYSNFSLINKEDIFENAKNTVVDEDNETMELFRSFITIKEN